MKLKVLFHKKVHLVFISVSKGKNRSVNHWAKTERNTECAKILRIWYSTGGSLLLEEGVIWKVQMHFFDLWIYQKMGFFCKEIIFELDR